MYRDQTEAFRKFHYENPGVYQALHAKALRALRRGRTFYSISIIYEAVRFDFDMTTFGNGNYKMANSHRAYYARLLMYKDERLKDFFRTIRQYAHNACDVSTLENYQP